MSENPKVLGYGNSFANPIGDMVTTADPKGTIVSSLYGTTDIDSPIEFSKFDKQIRDFVLARLGFPVIRVELTDYQVKSAIDEAIAKLHNHAPLWAKQYLVFGTVAGRNVYELPQYVLDNITYCGYKKSLLSAPNGSAGIEFDYLYRYFNSNFVSNDFSMGEYYLFQINMEMLRKTLGQDGTWEVINNRYLQIAPVPASDGIDVIVEYRALDSATIHPTYKKWIQRYALAIAKGILGQIRGKYQTLPGPGGGSVLNGQALVQESQQEMEKLERELYDELEEPPKFSMY
jgi:hypothetical protein